MLDYRVKRYGRKWVAFLRRPNPRPLFYEGRSKHEAIAALINGVARMAAEAPGRLFGPDWTKAANERAAKRQAAELAAHEAALVRAGN